MKHYRLWSLLLLLCSTLSGYASAGNLRSYLMADEAAMTGGAGIAVSRDSGSLWYNPAGLGGLSLGRMELTGTVYSLKIRPLRGLLETRLPSGTHEKSITAKEFQSVPTSLVFVRNASEKVSLGFAIYQTNTSNVDYRLALKVPYDGSGALWSDGMEFHQQASVYHAGPAFGVELSPRFRIGCSFYLLFMTGVVSLRGFAGVQNLGEDNLQSLSSLSSYGSIVKLGLTMTTGVQWEFVRHWHLGVVFRSPTFKFFESNDVSTLNSDAVVTNTDGGLTYDYDLGEESRVKFSQAIPLEAQIGLAYKRQSSFLGAEVAFRPPLEKANYIFVWNASLGGRLQISELFSWGAGVFTDRNAQKLTDVMMDWRSDRYGVTTGFEFKTPVLVKKILSEKEKATPPKQRDPDATKIRRLVWATTLAFSYAFELAEYNALYVDAISDLKITNKKKTSVFHQPTIYMGTALYF